MKMVTYQNPPKVTLFLGTKTCMQKETCLVCECPWGRNFTIFRSSLYNRCKSIGKISPQDFKSKFQNMGTQ